MHLNERKKNTVADIIALIERLAPPCLAESWDNSGLQIGNRKWPINKVWVALDPLLPVISAAADQQIDMLITHHPLIFKPLRSIDLGTCQGQAIEKALKAKIAIYAAHTNLDSACDGVNDVFAQRIGLSNLTVMVPVRSKNEGSEQTTTVSNTGMGRIGSLAHPVTLAQLAQHIKKQFGVKILRVSGHMDQRIQKVAVCSGSGRQLLSDFLTTDADVFVSGDLHYHDARTVESAGRGLIDIEHFASEYVIVDALCQKLHRAMSELRWDVHITPCKLEQAPFKFL